MTPEQQIYDAEQARLVLDNPQFVQAINDIEMEIFQAWQNSPIRDEQGRQEIFRLLKASQKIKAMLQSRLQTGTLAKLQMEQERALLTQDRAQEVNITGWSSPYL